MIKVGIADDSPFTCKLLASYLQESGHCRIVGFAHDAPSTISLMRTLTPDVLTLDLQMPGSDGLELLQQVAAEHPAAIVVISGVTRRAAATTLRALELGAVDFVLKYTPGVPVSAASLKREIVAKVMTAADARARRSPAATAVATASPAPAVGPLRREARRTPRKDEPAVIVIGSSTGGPGAVAELLAQLPKDFSAPCVIVQHLPAMFTTIFASQLERRTLLRVREAATGDRLEPGTVLVTPGAVNLWIKPDGRVELRPAPEHDLYRPSIDVAMTSAAESFGAGAVGVVLSGLGNDGAEGLKRIRNAGGEGYIQDPASCIVASMPDRALEHAGADHIGRPERIGQLLAARGKS